MSFLKRGTNSILNIDTYTYSSMHGTLDSIYKILRSGRINDAYSLLRKYYDSVVINLYCSLYLEEHSRIENFIVERIQDWIEGRVQLPHNKSMVKYIADAKQTKPVTTILLSDDHYKNIRDRCNAHTHFKFYQYVILNDNEVFLPTRIRYLESYRNDLRDLFILHTAYTFFLNDHYMMSSDYRDALDCGTKPEVDSQYWVAPFVQEMFDEVMTPKRPSITTAIREASAMQIS